jgi:hypothetical protein
MSQWDLAEKRFESIEARIDDLEKQIKDSTAKFARALCVFMGEADLDGRCRLLFSNMRAISTDQIKDSLLIYLKSEREILDDNPEIQEELAEFLYRRKYVYELGITA